MIMVIQFEPNPDFTSWMVNSAGYVISTEPANHHLFVGCRIDKPLKKINEGDLLPVVKAGEKVKIKYRVTEIKYLD